MLLRELTTDDAEVLASWGDDQAFRREAGWSAALSHDQIARFHRGVVESPPTDLLRLAATVDDDLVGYVDLHGGGRRRELGFLVGPRTRWGQGLGTRVARAGLDHGFDVLGLEEVWAEAADAHVASLSVLRRIGLQENGTGGPTTHLDRRGRYLRFTMDRAAWLALRQAPGDTSPDS